MLDDAFSEYGEPDVEGASTHQYIWKDGQCKNLGNWKVESAEACVGWCRHYRDVKNSGCNVVAYSRQKSICVMRKCPEPVPPPTAIDDYYTGYILDKN